MADPDCPNAFLSGNEYLCRERENISEGDYSFGRCHQDNYEKCLLAVGDSILSHLEEVLRERGIIKP